MGFSLLAAGLILPLRSLQNLHDRSTSGDSYMCSRIEQWGDFGGYVPRDGAFVLSQHTVLRHSNTISIATYSVETFISAGLL